MGESRVSHRDRMRQVRALGFHLSQLATERGVSVREIAARCQATEPMVRHWLAGQIPPTLEVAPELCDLLGCTIEELCMMPRDDQGLPPATRRELERARWAIEWLLQGDGSASSSDVGAQERRQICQDLHNSRSNLSKRRDSACEA